MINLHSVSAVHGKILFPRAMRKIAMLAWIFDECREGQIPRPLGRCKIDTPLLAAGSLIYDLDKSGVIYL